LKPPYQKYLKPFATFSKLFFTCIILFGASTISPQALKSQEKYPTYRNIDSLSYALYKQQQWDELIVAGNAALKHSIDYYYLRMRMGIAWYTKQNYRQAIPHFEGALKFNELDEISMEYLYYCYLLSGRQYDVRRLLPKLSKSSKEKMGITGQQIFEEIYVEGGPSIASNQELKDDWGHPKAEDNIYNSTYFYDQYTYLHAGLRFKIHPNISTYQAYENTQAPFVQKIRYQNQELEDFTYTATQNDYYGNFVIGLPGGVQVIPAYHIIWLEYNDRKMRYDSATFRLVSDTLQFNTQDYVMSFSVKKDFPVFAIEMNGAYGDFGRNNQIQLGISGYTYPFGNLNLYTQASLINRWSGDDYSLIFYQMIGGRVAKRLWLEASFTIGDLSNYAENNAFVIYNAPEKINYKFETAFIYSLNEYLEFSIRYRLMQRENKYLYFYTLDSFEQTTSKYLYQTVIGAIKYRF